MLLVAMRLLDIKDLKDFSVFFWGRGYYRHAGPKGPEEAFFAQVERSRGTGPRATGPEGVLLAMRRSGSGDPELQSLANRGNRDNPAHLLLIVIIL